MIRGLFCHSLQIYRDKNGVYCSTTLTNELFSRYYQVVDSLVVATRIVQIETTYEEAHQDKIDLPNLKIVGFENLNNPKTFLTQYGAEKRKMEKLVQKSDLIFIRGGVIAILGAEVSKDLDKPYLVESASCAWDEYWHYSLLGKFVAPVMEYKTKKIIKNADFVLYVTEKWLQKRYPTKAKTTYASNVIIDSADDEVLEKRLRKINYCSKKRLVFGTTGGISTKAKGQHYMIQAMAMLRKKYDIRYEIVGGGDTAFLRSVAHKFGVEDKVVFKGQLTHNEVLQWLDSIDIYVQPSMQEGLPRALIEAMSRGCPAIGSTTAGIPELLEQDVVFKRGKPKDLKRKIEILCNGSLKKRAIRNFNKAQEYELKKLNVRREKIYSAYLEHVLKRKQNEN